MSEPRIPSLDRLRELVQKSGLVEPGILDALWNSGRLPADPEGALEVLIEAGLITRFHARHLGQGKYSGFLLGSYKVLTPVGKGGMGMVYLAEHLQLRRRVALKVVRTDLQAPGLRERFQRESRTAAALDHPNIVQVHDFCTEQGVSFLVMEYVEGKSLEEILRRKGRLPWPQAVQYVLQAAHGLEHAHERGVVHRDIKPANLLLDARGVVKILDMGLAKFVEDRNDDLTERLGGKSVVGSPDYVAPEQILERLDPRSDVYSLGATLYALLLGQPPFHSGPVSQKLLAHQSVAVVPPDHKDPTIPVALSAVVLRMLAKAPDDRIQTPRKVIEALAPLVAEPAPPLPGNDQAPLPRTRARRGVAWIVWLGILLGFLLAALAWWTLR